jgi:hypothetical protein
VLRIDKQVSGHITEILYKSTVPAYWLPQHEAQPQNPLRPPIQNFKSFHAHIVEHGDIIDVQFTRELNISVEVWQIVYVAIDKVHLAWHC